LAAKASAQLDNQDPALFGQTPWQTVGPFFHYALPWKGGADLVGQSELGARPELFPDEHDILTLSPPRGAISGPRIEIAGRILDGAGNPVPDAMVEIWQSNAAGRYRSPDDNREELPLDDGFIGFGRSSTGADGDYRFVTILPGRVPGPGNSLQAPHIAVSVMGRGLLKRLVTRIYFAGTEGLDTDPILACVPPARRSTLIAVREPAAPRSYRFDIVLRGKHEAVFFDI
jgi:protocatechuate 3,4-dioxygenase alpha subunit